MGWQDVVVMMVALAAAGALAWRRVRRPARSAAAGPHAGGTGAMCAKCDLADDTKFTTSKTVH